MASIQHYLVIEQDRRRVVHHRRGGDGDLEPRILRDGVVPLDPPGIAIDFPTIYAETALADP